MRCSAYYPGNFSRVPKNLVNWQQEEPTDCGEERQLLLNGTSRVNREVYAWFCERLEGKFVGPTRRVSGNRHPYRECKSGSFSGCLKTSSYVRGHTFTLRLASRTLF